MATGMGRRPQIGRDDTTGQERLTSRLGVAVYSAACQAETNRVAKEAMTQLDLDAGFPSSAAVSGYPQAAVPITARLKEAIERDELSLHYQPQYRSVDGRLCGIEALARWFPRNAQPISPISFI